MLKLLSVKNRVRVRESEDWPGQAGQRRLSPERAVAGGLFLLCPRLSGLCSTCVQRAGRGPGCLCLVVIHGGQCPARHLPFWAFGVPRSGCTEGRYCN